MKYPLLNAAIVTAIALLGCSKESQVSYKNDVKPIIDQYCAECHLQGGEGAISSGLLLTDHASLMKGTKYGPVIVPGNSAFSTLYRLVSGQADPSIQMPHGKEALTAEQVKAIEVWIDQGAIDN